MADGGAGPPQRPAARGEALGLRLALAFLAVALAAVALLAGLTAAFAAADVSGLAARQRQELTTAIAVAAAAAWERDDSWTSADLSPVLDLAARTGAARCFGAIGAHDQQSNHRTCNQPFSCLPQKA